jgi:hypothetical protein
MVKNTTPGLLSENDDKINYNKDKIIRDESNNNRPGQHDGLLGGEDWEKR